MHTFYLMAWACGARNQVHEKLMPLGTHIIVERTKLDSTIKARLPDDDTTYLLGWLRYPDEQIKDNKQIHVAFRVIDRSSHRRSDMEDVEILSFPACDCMAFAHQQEIPRDACVDFIYL